MRRALALAVVVLGVLAPTATAATTLNVIPHGQWEPGVSWARAPGMLPAETQAQMYDRLTPLFRDVTDAQLVPSADGTGFYKSAALVDENDPSLITNDTVAGTAPGVGAVSARIKRDAYGVPHIYSDTDAGVTFAAGYVTAQDRSLLLDQARANGVAALIDMPGVPAIQLVLRPLHLQADQEGPRRGDRAADQVDRGAGRPGAPAAERHRRLPGGHQPLVLAEQPDDGAVHAHRHLRPERAQVAVPGPGRRPGGRQRLVPRRRALQARRDPRRRGLRGPARALRPRDRDHDDAQLPRPDQGQRGQAARHGAASSTAASARPRPSSRPRRARPRRGRPRSTIPSGRRSWPATSSSRAGRRRRRGRRSSWAARRSATTTPA